MKDEDMTINIKDYILNSIGSTSWAGESNHDNESSTNLWRLDMWLTYIEGIRDELLSQLNEHRYYREGNASAEHLHSKAGRILKNHLCYVNYDQMTDDEFDEYWDGKDE